MKGLKTSKGEFVVVDMEHNSWFQNTPLPKGYTTEGFIKLSEATEDDAKLIVITHESESINTHLMKLHFILKSKGIDINNGNWYLFKKI